MSQDVNRQSTGRLLAYSLAGIPAAAVALPLIAFLPPYYANEVGLGLALTGAVFMYSRFWDAFADMLMGGALDNVRLPGGTRRPWLLLSCPIIAISIYMIFNPPVGASGLYLFASLVILSAGFAMFGITHRVWASELSDDYHERTRNLGFVEFVYFAGYIGAAFVPLAMLGQPESVVMKTMGWGALIGCIVLIPFSAFIMGEPRRVADPVPFRTYFASLWSLRTLSPMWYLVIVDMLVSLSVGAVSALLVFYAKHALGSPDYDAPLLLASLVGVLVAVPIWTKISKKTGKRNGTLLGLLLGGLGAIATAVAPPFGLVATLVSLLIFGLGVGAVWFLIKTCVPDVADYDRVENGKDRPSLLFGLIVFTNKAGLGLAVGLSYPLLALFDFDPTADIGKTATYGLHWVIGGLPAVALAIAAIAMWRYPIDEARQAADRAKVDAMLG